MIWVFRFEKSNSKMGKEGRQDYFDELVLGRLHQGWGWKGMSLIGRNGNVLSSEAWEKKYHGGGPAESQAQEKEAKGNYERLSRMLEIREGDRIIVPNLSREGRKGLVLATAKHEPGRGKGKPGECYGFSSSVPESFNGDRRHYVRVDPVKSKFFSYRESASAKALPNAIRFAGLWHRVESVDDKKNRAIVRLLNKIAGEVLDATPRKTIKDARVGVPLSPDQQERGRKGEEEILRRFESGAVKGLRLLKDHRSKGGGYDFLCQEVKGKRTVELELKTFKALDGQIVLTPKEFQRASTESDRYYLWGLEDNGKLPKDWELRTLQAPHAEIKRLAVVVYHITHHMVAADVRWEKDDLI
jgi:hypothetical protein